MSLMKLAQITGGTRLRSDVDALQRSYEAAKVLTDIAKTGENAGSYNVNELLKELKENIATITGDDSKDVTSLKSLKSAVDAINDRKVSDYVRLDLAVSNNVLDISTVAEKVPGLDTTKALPVYSTDGKILYDENGNQLTVNMTSGALSGTPSVIDEVETAKKTDGTRVYEAFSATTLRIYPQGTWTFSSVPADAALDNDEMKLVTYQKALDDIVIELAKDKTLIANVQALIGEKTVSDQLETQKTALEAKISDAVTTAANNLATAKTELEGKITEASTTAQTNLEAAERDLNEKITKATTDAQTNLNAAKTELQANIDKKFDSASVVTSTAAAAEGHTAAEDKVLSEAAVESKFQAAAAKEAADIAAVKKAAEDGDAALKTAADALTTRVSAIEAAEEQEVTDKVAVTSATAVTAFTLAKKPTAELVRAFINGVAYFEGEDFTVDRSAKTATWTATAAAGGFDITSELTDKMIFVYNTLKA